MPKRDWSDARAKVDAEGVCRVCGFPRKLESAHIAGRKFDEPKNSNSKTLYVKPERIVPLCGIPVDGKFSCHLRYDAHRLDLLGYLTSEEEAQAVLDLGSIESARRRLCPSAYRETVA